MEWVDVLVNLVDRIGVPLAFGVIVVVWLRPWIERLMQSHIDFTKSIAETQHKQAKTQEDSFELLSSLHAMHRGNRKALGHIAEAIHDSTPEEKKRDISRHIQAVREALTDP